MSDYWPVANVLKIIIFSNKVNAFSINCWVKILLLFWHEVCAFPRNWLCNVFSHVKFRFYYELGHNFKINGNFFTKLFAFQSVYTLSLMYNFIQYRIILSYFNKKSIWHIYYCKFVQIIYLSTTLFKETLIIKVMFRKSSTEFISENYLQKFCCKHWVYILLLFF